ncbi:MAG: peptidoglycan DD-metalloendopeptidase family protein [Rhodanobacteraceae bacterium]|nr:peptidoglycan DD-metalloendopeptidase family protein [Rhodanobacteraceae bacterium]
MVLALLLNACASTPPAPVEDIALDDGPGPATVTPRSPRPTAAAATHKVVAGDTLYSIAFKNGLDYRELARINRIDAPFRIYAGQELKLADPASSEAVAVAAAPAASAAQVTALPDEPPRKPATATPPSTPADVRGSGSTAAAGNERIASASPAPGKSAAGSTAVAPAPASTATPPLPPAAPAVSPPPKGAASASAANTPAAATNTPAAATNTTAAATLSSGGVSWRWPAGGKVVGTFVAGDQTRQGVDIAGAAGANVAAAADGTVVYSGNGLLGYGELVIVKHSASFLSAYGHNRKRLVKEGDTVKAGQVIAEMGGSNREMLHFEIRRNGKPVNPLEYLPAR